jgi:hypothetical protein
MILQSSVGSRTKIITRTRTRAHTHTHTHTHTNTRSRTRTTCYNVDCWFWSTTRSRWPVIRWSIGTYEVDTPLIHVWKTHVHGSWIKRFAPTSRGILVLGLFQIAPPGSIGNIFFWRDPRPSDAADNYNRTLLRNPTYSRTRKTIRISFTRVV